MVFEDRALRSPSAGLGIQEVDEASDSDSRAPGSRYYSDKDLPDLALRGKERRDVIGHFKVEPIGPDSLVASWTWRRPELKKNVKITNIYYFPQGSNTNMRISPDVSHLIGSSYTLHRDPADTQYRVCIRVQKQGTMSSMPDDIVCRDSSPQPWHMPASIGSSVGALLALVVVILVMVSLQRKRRHRRMNGGGPASKRSRIDSALESQFDSIAFREETSFYDDATTIYDSTCGASAPESCLHSSCGANSALLAGLSSQLSASSAASAASAEQQLEGGQGGGSQPDGSVSPSGTPGLEPGAPLLGRQVSTSGPGKSVTFKEERKGRISERDDSDESRDVEPASVVMETSIDASPGLPGTPGDAAEQEKGSGIYTQLIETI